MTPITSVKMLSVARYAAIARPIHVSLARRGFSASSFRSHQTTDIKMASPKETVQQAIAANAVMVFSKSYCPYCTKVKGLFKSINVPFYAIELDQVANGDAIQSALRDLTGQSTVPNVFVKGKHVGGCDDTHKKHSTGELAKLLA